MDSFSLQLHTFFQRFWLEPFWFALLISTLLLLAMLFLLPSVFDALRVRKRFGVFKRIADDSMHDIFVPDGVGGNVYIAHLLLMPDQIAVFNEKPFAGKIFGDVNVDQWTQSIRQRSFRFANPLVELQSQIVAINALVGQRCTTGYLVFSDDSEFPWGKPENVYLRKELVEAFPNDRHQIQDWVKQAWSRLQQLGVSGKPVSPRHRNYMIALVFIVVTFSLLGWLGYEQAPALMQLRTIMLG
ncbi:MAG: hypothetical protein COC09_04315 [Gammaproteobacteria bacterium]|nr:NERD domain-containing protein [Gammaproteobacteria bacterium]PCH63920.1 MAG: hypothetical protein COC09_04315 [Gammaproteobacteria bacterium]